MKRLRPLLGLLLGVLLAAAFIGFQLGLCLLALAAIRSGSPVRSAGAHVDGGAEPALFIGLVWVDGAEPAKGTPVQAFVGDTECGESTTTTGGNVAGQWVHGFIGRAMYLVSVPSSDERPGCGTEGASVSFLIGGKKAHQTGQCKAGMQFLHLTAGAQPAIFSGALTIDDGPVDRDTPIQAFIGDVLCGELKVAADSEPPLPEDRHYRHLAVLPSEAKAGCGTDGAQIRFAVGNMQAKETATWAPGFHSLDLSATTMRQEALTPTSRATATSVASPTPSLVPSPSPTRAATPTASPWPSPTVTLAPENPPKTGAGGDDGLGLPWLAAALVGGAAAVAATAFAILRRLR